MALPRLEVLRTFRQPDHGPGLAQIARMNTLKTLDLEATEITDAGLVYPRGDEESGRR